MSALTHARHAVAMCRTLATCSDAAGGTTRTFLSPAARDVHARLGQWMQQAGMQTRVDMAGNLRGALRAPNAGAPTFYIGSHLDTVPDAGAFDGILGVTIGVALVAMLQRRELPFHVEVVGFSEEEGVRFGVPFIGSRAFTGSADAGLLGRCDAGGCSIATALRDFGLDPDRLDDAGAADDAVGYCEFHIEQGPVLDGLGLPLGIVTAIVGQTRGEMTFTGMAGHAGTTPMPDRRDALAAAAEWILDVEREAANTAGAVATVGRIEVIPGAPNVIAGRCRATLDVRHAEDAARDELVRTLVARATAIGGRRRAAAGWESRLDQPAVAMDAGLVSLLEQAARDGGHPVHRMASGAGHDAMIVAGRMPAAMVFLRTPNGVSHHPDETVLEEDVAAALDVGVRLIDALAERFA